MSDNGQIRMLQVFMLIVAAIMLAVPLALVW
jgi:hypothetical protein